MAEVSRKCKVKLKSYKCIRLNELCPELEQQGKDFLCCNLMLLFLLKLKVYGILNAPSADVFPPGEPHHLEGVEEPG